MRPTKTLKIALLAAAFAALAIAPAAQAVTSNGKTVAVKVSCTGSAGATTPGGDAIYQGPYGGGNPTPGTTTAGGGCSGTIALRAAQPRPVKPAPGGATKSAKKRKQVKIGSTVFTLSRGQTKKVLVKLSPRGRKALRALRKLRATVKISSSAAVSAPKQIKIKLKKKKKPAAK